MDPKKLETRLCEWSRQLGFTLPDGSFPPSSLFSLLITTPNTVHLWEKILEKVEPRDKVQKIRKQILIAKLKSDEKPDGHQDPVLNVNTPGIQRKVELWKKKKLLEKMIVEKRKEVDVLRDDVHRKAQLIQNEACKLAETEKTESDLKEKLLLSNLLIQNHTDIIENCKEQLKKIKSFEKPADGMDGFERHRVLERVKNIEAKMIEKLDRKKIEDNNSNEIIEVIGGNNSLSKLWDLLLDIKNDNMKEYLSKIDENDKRNENEEDLLGKLEEKFMLDITEYSLQTILNRKLEKIEDLKLKRIISEIEKLMFNTSISSSSQVDISYMGPNETGDSLTGRQEKMSKLVKAFSYHGLKKRNEFLKREIEKLSKENKKREHWTSEKEKYANEVLRSIETLEAAKVEAMELISVHKSSAQAVLKSHSEFVLLVNDIKNDMKEKKLFDGLTKFVSDIKMGSERQLELVSDMCLDVYRRIHISPGKEVYGYESLHHCLDNYGGELREFFSSQLLSPYDKPEAVISKLEERESFLSYVKDAVAKAESDLKNSQTRFAEVSGESINLKAIDRNYKECLREVTKVIARFENLKTELDFAENLLKSWYEQPYRLMIPDSVKVNSMTLRQFEEKYRTAQSEIKHCMELKEREVYK